MSRCSGKKPGPNVISDDMEKVEGKPKLHTPEGQGSWAAQEATEYKKKH